jgi:hypothetical protein
MTRTRRTPRTQAVMSAVSGRSQGGRTPRTPRTPLKGRVRVRPGFDVQPPACDFLRGPEGDTRKGKVRLGFPGCGLAPTVGTGHDVRSGQQPFLPGVHATSQRARGAP